MGQAAAGLMNGGPVVEERLASADAKVNDVVSDISYH
jgi:hypothetical protein